MVSALEAHGLGKRYRLRALGAARPRPDRRGGQHHRARRAERVGQVDPHPRRGSASSGRREGSSGPGRRPGPTARRPSPVGYVPQAPSLYRGLTVDDHIAFAADCGPASIAPTRRRLSRRSLHPARLPRRRAVWGPAGAGRAGARARHAGAGPPPRRAAGEPRPARPARVPPGPRRGRPRGGRDRAALVTRHHRHRAGLRQAHRAGRGPLAPGRLDRRGDRRPPVVEGARAAPRSGRTRRRDVPGGQPASGCRSFGRGVDPGRAAPRHSRRSSSATSRRDARAHGRSDRAKAAA